MLDKKILRKMSKDLIADPDDYMTSFRRNIFMYIGAKGMTLADLAEHADLPLSTLRTFLYGDSKDCHVSTVVKLARALNISCDELLGSGTISPQTCESLQLVRQLPESFTHFVRWAIHYHYKMLNSHKVTSKAIEIMQAESADNGNFKMNNNFELLDISDLNDDIRPKIFMGIRVPSALYEPNYFENDILLIANDRVARPTENVIVNTDDNMWILKRKEEIIDGEKQVNYYSIRDGRKRGNDSTIQFVIGYVVKVIHS